MTDLFFPTTKANVWSDSVSASFNMTTTVAF